MQPSTPQEILEKLKNCKQVIMSLHSSPDGDSLGGATAFKYFLENYLNIQVKLVSGDPLPDNLNSLSLNSEVDFSLDISEVDLSKFDALICTDTGSPALLSTKQKKRFQFPENIFIINIDHHHTNPFYGNLNFIDTNNSSCCEVLVDFFKLLKINIDYELSKRLLIGIASDTQVFRFGYNKSSKLLKNVAFLIDKGIDIEKEVINPLIFNQSINYKRFQGLVLSNLKFDPAKKIAYSIVSQDEWQNLNIPDIYASSSIASNLIQDIANINLVFSLVERSDHIRGSFRSRGKVDVSPVAQDLNGGGHKEAAGFALKKIPMEEAVKTVFEAIDRTINNK